MSLFKILAYACVLQHGTSYNFADNLTKIRTELNLSTGYRNDNIQRINCLQIEPNQISQKDSIKIKSINLWQIGFNGRLIMPNLDDNCSNYSFLNNFFISGFAYWGLGGKNSKLCEQITSTTLETKQIGKARLKDARMSDYQIGLGYLFDKNCWNLSLSGGYAFDKQKIRTKCGEIALSSTEIFLYAPIYGCGYKTITKWNGPWIGTEIFYRWDLYRLSLGYDFHAVKYKANHCIPPIALAQEQGMSTITKSSHGFGNALSLNGRYFFQQDWENWECGILLTYKNWNANKGSLKSLYFNNNGYSPTTKTSATGRWISYAVNFDIGYIF